MRRTILVVLIMAFVLPVTAALYAQPEIVVMPADKLSMTMQRNLRLLTDPLQGNVKKEDMDSDTFAYKMGEGLTNIATSWTDVPRQIADVSEDSNVLAGYTLGFGKGLIVGIVRVISGSFDVATFGLPPYDQPLMKPEYKVDDPDREGYKIDLFRW